MRDQELFDDNQKDVIKITETLGSYLGVLVTSSGAMVKSLCNIYMSEDEEDIPRKLYELYESKTAVSSSHDLDELGAQVDSLPLTRPVRDYVEKACRCYNWLADHIEGGGGKEDQERMVSETRKAINDIDIEEESTNLLTALSDAGRWLFNLLMDEMFPGKLDKSIESSGVYLRLRAGIRRCANLEQKFKRSPAGKTPAFMSEPIKLLKYIVETIKTRFNKSLPGFDNQQKSIFVDNNPQSTHSSADDKSDVGGDDLFSLFD